MSFQLTSLFAFVLMVNSIVFLFVHKFLDTVVAPIHIFKSQHSLHSSNLLFLRKREGSNLVPRARMLERYPIHNNNP